MEASIVDLRYRMKDVLKALDRNEEVRILYHGKLKGVIRPSHEAETVKVCDHPLFGSEPKGRPVDEVMDELRGGRHT